jgi:hypothetical protein
VVGASDSGEAAGLIVAAGALADPESVNAGGDVMINAGSSAGTNGGRVAVTSGLGKSGAGGVVSISAGDGFSGAGASVNLRGGAMTLGVAGQVSVAAGSVDGGEGAAFGEGGALALVGGAGFDATGGTVHVRSGTGALSSSGIVSFSSAGTIDEDSDSVGASGTATARTGNAGDAVGQMTLKAGSAGLGAAGSIVFAVGDGSSGSGGAIGVTAGASISEITSVGGMLNVASGSGLLGEGGGISLTAGSSEGGTGGSISLLSGKGAASTSGRSYRRVIVLSCCRHIIASCCRHIILHTGGETQMRSRWVNSSVSYSIAIVPASCGYFPRILLRSFPAKSHPKLSHPKMMDLSRLSHSKPPLPCWRPASDRIDAIASKHLDYNSQLGRVRIVRNHCARNGLIEIRRVRGARHRVGHNRFRRWWHGAARCGHRHEWRRRGCDDQQR